MRFLKFILLGYSLVVLLSCGKNKTVCDVEHPLTDLQWLEELTTTYVENKQNGFYSHVKIYQCTYDNKARTGFLIDNCVGCPDAGYSLYDCEGNNLCVMWGVTGNDCKEFDVDFENKKLIWDL
jgi:hypothetical protein